MHLGPAGTRPAAGIVTGAALLLVAACSAAPAPAPESGAAEPGSAAAVLVQGTDPHGTAPEVVLRSRVTRIAGHLSDVRRERVARQARAAVQDYLDGAFAGADEGPFHRFQAGLRRAARADAKVLAEPGDLGATRAAAWFSVAAPDGRPVGITARLRVERDTDGGAADALTGRLLLTRTDGRWQVFGYDLARGER